MRDPKGHYFSARDVLKERHRIRNAFKPSVLEIRERGFRNNSVPVSQAVVRFPRENVGARQ